MGRKNKKSRVKNQGPNEKREHPEYPPPPKRWWSARLDSSKVIAGATIGLIIAGIGTTAVTIHNSNLQYHQQHRPKVIMSRPPEILEPFTCDMGKGIVNLAKTQQWIKNIGDTEAKDVFPYSEAMKIIPDKKSGIPLIDDLPNITDSTCDTVFKGSTGITFALAPNQEISPQSSVAITIKGPLSKDASVQLFESDCVFYLDPDDHDAPHDTCATYRFFTEDGSPSFRCGSPIRGTFQLYVSGHCAN